MASTDTQWPRYQVFLQEKEGEPYQDVGSVHAPDPELALLNARDVFVRRPECSGLWVVPADGIYARTAQEIEEEGRRGEGEKGEVAQEEAVSTSSETYVIACKARAAGTMTVAGELPASSPPMALRQAFVQFSGDRPPFAWWVFPSRLVTRSQPEDAESMFAPAWRKPFRLATDFHTLSAMREIKRGKAVISDS
jgi:ring-1,2-phenylacetyl-CoA epoxidase subunit PaaB